VQRRGYAHLTTLRMLAEFRVTVVSRGDIPQRAGEIALHGGETQVTSASIRSERMEMALFSGRTASDGL
jgi:hypothetical protein